MIEHIPINPNIAGIVILPPSVSREMKNISASAKNTVALNISSNANIFRNFDFGIYKYKGFMKIISPLNWWKIYCLRRVSWKGTLRKNSHFFLFFLITAFKDTASFILFAELSVVLTPRRFLCQFLLRRVRAASITYQFSPNSASIQRISSALSANQQRLLQTALL